MGLLVEQSSVPKYSVNSPKFYIVNIALFLNMYPYILYHSHSFPSSPTHPGSLSIPLPTGRLDFVPPTAFSVSF